MKKIVTFIITIALVLAFGSFEGVKAVSDTIVDKLTSESLCLGSTYADYHSKQHDSGAIYHSYATTPKNGNIQINDKHNAGIVVEYAPTNYIPTAIKLVWDSATSPNVSLSVYGKNERYLSVAELHDAKKQGENLGYTTKADSSAVLDLQSNYKYIGIRSDNRVIYLKYIEITWTRVGNDNTASVTFNLNNGNPSQVITNKVNDKLIYVPTLNKPFNKFAGWFKDSNLTEAFDLANEVITSDLTLYAKWDALAITRISDLASLNNNTEVVIEGVFSTLDVAKYYLEDETGLIEIHEKALTRDCVNGKFYQVHGRYNSIEKTLSNVVAIKEVAAKNPIEDVTPLASLRINYEGKSATSIDLRLGALVKPFKPSRKLTYGIILVQNNETIDTSKLDEYESRFTGNLDISNTNEGAMVVLDILNFPKDKYNDLYDIYLYAKDEANNVYLSNRKTISIMNILELYKNDPSLSEYLDIFNSIK